MSAQRRSRTREAPPAGHERLSEFLGILSLALAALVTISLISFDPLDRSFFVEPQESFLETRNLAGQVGALVASLMLSVIGLVSFVVPVSLFLFGWRRFRHRPVQARPAAAIGFGLLMLSVATLLTLSFGDVSFASEIDEDVAFSVPAGGLGGHLIATGTSRLLGRAGSFIAALSCAAGSLVLTTRFSFRRFAAATWSWLLELSNGFGTAFTRWLEQRRKARNRSRVARQASKDSRERRDAKASRGVVRDSVDEAALRQPAEPSIPALPELAFDLDSLPIRDRAPTPVAAEPTPAPPEPDIEHHSTSRAAWADEPLIESAPAPTPQLEATPAPPEAAAAVLPTSEPDAEPLPARPIMEPQTSEVRIVRGKERKGKKRGDYVLPEIDILDRVENESGLNEKELVDNAKRILAKLAEFAVEGTVQQIHPGPVVTTYEFRPKAGVKYSKIVGLADDLCLALKAEAIRIDRISGKSAVGIEVPNQSRELIGLREILESDSFENSSSVLTLAVGKLINGEPYSTDLRKMPHLLIAGATGAGKSVAVNCMLVSILCKARPDQVKLIMVDPKRIELGVYKDIPHLLVPVVTEPKLAANALRWATAEMEARYKRLASYGVRDIDQFNLYLKSPEAKKLYDDPEHPDLKPLPYIVIVIDELADLMAIAASEVEDSISRLAAMARAVGIHLILATQRPSVDVITGVIKANFPSRISFRVSSKVDSRTVLDSNGAEQLLGKGDMLFMPPGSSRLKRIHGPFISDAEVGRLVAAVKQRARPEFNEEVLKCGVEKEKLEIDNSVDTMYEEAVRVVLETGQASVSHLQRRLRLGYSRAARLVDMMELNGIVGPKDGSRSREILVDSSFLERLEQA